MKKFTFAVTALALACLLAACGGTADSSAPTSDGTPAGADAASDAGAAAADTSPAVDFSLQEQVLFEGSGIKITATDAAFNAYTYADGREGPREYVVNLKVENDSPDDIVISKGFTWINGYELDNDISNVTFQFFQSDPFVSMSYDIDIPAGETLTPQLILSDSSIIPLEDGKVVPEQWFWRPTIKKGSSNESIADAPRIEVPRMEIVTSATTSAAIDPPAIGDVVYEDDAVTLTIDSVEYVDYRDTYFFAFNAKNKTDTEFTCTFRYNLDGNGDPTVNYLLGSVLPGTVTVLGLPVTTEDMAEFYDGAKNPAEMPELGFYLDLTHSEPYEKFLETDKLSLTNEWLAAHYEPPAENE